MTRDIARVSEASLFLFRSPLRRILEKLIGIWVISAGPPHWGLTGADLIHVDFIICRYLTIYNPSREVPRRGESRTGKRGRSGVSLSASP